MLDQRTAPYAALLLRLALGTLFILHIYRKFYITGIDTWWSTFEHDGYPAWVLIYVLLAESLAAVALPLGIGTRWVSLFALPLTLGASQYWLVRHGYWFSQAGAEFPLLWSAALLVLALLGEGAWALDWRRSGRWARPRH